MSSLLVSTCFFVATVLFLMLCALVIVPAIVFVCQVIGGVLYYLMYVQWVRHFGRKDFDGTKVIISGGFGCPVCEIKMEEGTTELDLREFVGWHKSMKRVYK